MPITLDTHLKDRNNRSLLIVLSKEELDEDDCCDTLATYGSVRQCALTSDKRAAFVDFDCEHSPLLAARCLNYHKNNPEVPMPKGTNMLLPGCSFSQFLFLQHVPRAVANCTLKTTFSVWNNRVINVYRPACDDPHSFLPRPSSRVLLELTGKASQFTKGQMTIHYVNEAGSPLQFYAIPSIRQLWEYKNIEKSPGCVHCNIPQLIGVIAIEEEKKNAASRDPSDHDLIQKEEVPEESTTLSLEELDYKEYVEDMRKWFEPPQEQPIDRRVLKPPTSALPSTLPSVIPSLPPFPPPIDYVPPPVPCETRNEETIEYRNPTPQDLVQPTTSVRSHQLNDSSFDFPFPISHDGYAPKLRFEKIFRRKDRTRPTSTGVQRVKPVVPESRFYTREQLLAPRESECEDRETPTLSDLIGSEEESDENGDSLSPSERIDFDNIPLMHYEPRKGGRKEHPFLISLFANPEPRASQSSARQAPVSASASAALIMGKDQTTQRVPPKPAPTSIRPLSAPRELFDHQRSEKKEKDLFLRPVSHASARDSSTTASKARNTPTPINEKENTRSEAPLASEPKLRRNLANVLMGRGNGREERVTGLEEDKEEKDGKKVEKEEKKVKKEEEKVKKVEKEVKKVAKEEKKVAKEEEKVEKEEKKVEKEEKEVEKEVKKVDLEEKKAERDEKRVTPHPPLVPLSAPLQEKKSEGMKVKKEHPLAQILFGKKKELDTPSPSDLKEEEKEAQLSASGASSTALEARESTTLIEPSNEEKEREEGRNEQSKSMSMPAPEVVVDVINDGSKSPFLPELIDENIPTGDSPVLPEDVDEFPQQLAASAAVQALQQEEEVAAPLTSPPPSELQPLQQMPLDLAPGTPKSSGKNLLLIRRISTASHRSSEICGETVGGYVKSVRGWSGPSEVESGDSKKGRKEAVSRWLNNGNSEENDLPIECQSGARSHGAREDKEEGVKGQEEEKKEGVKGEEEEKKDTNDEEVIKRLNEEEKDEGEKAVGGGEQVVSITPSTPLWLGREAVDSDDESEREMEEDDILDSSTHLPSIDSDESGKVEQRAVVDSLISTDCVVVSRRWSGDEDEEKENEKVVSSIDSMSKKNAVKSEDEGKDKGEEKEAGAQQKAVNSSSSLTPRWCRSSVLDQDEDGDYRSSEYQSWLTRDYGMEAVGGEVSDCSSSEEEAGIVPLPSSLSTTTWGKGIEVEDQTTV